MHTAIRHPTILRGVETISILSDRSFARHSHDEFGFGYVAAGGQTSWSGRGQVDAQVGDIITVNPAELHDGIVPTGQPRQWHMMYIAPDVMADCANRPGDMAAFDHPVLRDSRRCVLVQQALATATAPNPDLPHIEERLLLALRAVLQVPRRPTDTGSKTCAPAVARVVAQIHADWARPLSLSDFAATAGLSRFQILRHFTKEIGATPHAYLTQHRVKQARRDIRAGLPLAEAALAAGFADQSHMTRAFQRQFGLSPGRLAQG